MDIEKFKIKLEDPKAIYSDEEVEWLLDNIGNPESEIRDNLVCNSFGNGFFEEKFTFDQVKYLINQLQEKNLLYYRINEKGIATLTRSFTCLLWDLIIKTNNDVKSKYYRSMDQEHEKRLFNEIIYYLSREQDFTGFSERYGWVHAIAHYSDALADSIVCDNFDQKMVDDLLASTKKMLNKVDKRFIDGEEYRLADVFVNGIRVNKINYDNFINWIESFHLNPYSDELLEYYRFNNLKVLLQDIYVKLNSISLLNPNVKEIIEKKFNSEY